MKDNKNLPAGEDADSSKFFAMNYSLLLNPNTSSYPSTSYLLLLLLMFCMSELERVWDYGGRVWSVVCEFGWFEGLNESGKVKSLWMNREGWIYIEMELTEINYVILKPSRIG